MNGRIGKIGSDTMSFFLGTNQYEILNQIGQGAFGKSYLARENVTKNKVVIKVIDDDKIWRSIKKNEQVLFSLDNEYITHIYELKVFRHHKCIIQEYVNGVNLHAYISDNDMTLEDLLIISSEVLKAIKYLGQINFSHKDIKPSNIIYDKDEKAAKLIDLDMSVLSLHNHNYAGTLKYSAPEQIISNNPSNKADIYSFGIVLCFMILGNITFDIDLRKTAQQLKENIEHALRAVDLNAYIIDQIIMLVNGLLEYEPEKRLTPSMAIQLIEKILEISNAENQGATIIHKHMDACCVVDSNHTLTKESVAIMKSVDSLTIILEDSVSTINPVNHTTFFGKDAYKNNLQNNKKMFQNDEETTTMFLQERRKNQNIYREQLLKEYDNILLQAKISFGLWVATFIICFIIAFVSLYLVVTGKYTEGVMTVILDALVVAIQKLFNIKEDYYRKLMEQKMKHLETGDYLDYAFEKVDKLNNIEDKNREIKELIKTIREQANKIDVKEN